ncbi:response regulator [Flavobacterium capsici]|uniref:Response regulator n=1 Tax=Flavobacterium capsici TaxID=3075618 RepID=A0AA96J213_9FLAO|nr:MULTISPECIES: response regulator [unclassified Flavobacterium]WNM19002.1 response regulator [Flavobacterium sp. PMR2A8]WNM23052.1 response regulator [Flavobacterium sp. PMTSA4]
MKFNDIYVVDDDKVFHFIIKKLLENNNINVRPDFFENGLLAINGLKKKIIQGENLPDLILLDINMPVLDGWQFLEEFKVLKSKLNKDVIIYIVSSSDNKSDLNKAKTFQDEVKDYYLKPMTSEDLKAMFSN